MHSQNLFLKHNSKRKRFSSFSQCIADDGNIIDGIFLLNILPEEQTKCNLKKGIWSLTHVVLCLVTFIFILPSPGVTEAGCFEHILSHSFFIHAL